MKVYDSEGKVKLAGAGGGGITAINVSAGTTSNNLTALTFSNANGLSFGLDASTITGSHNGLTSQSNQNVTAANGGFAFQTLSFSNLNGISFGTSAGSAITASHNALTSQSNQAFSADGGSSAFQTLSFSNANGISFSNNAGQVQASYTVPTQSNQTLGGYFVGNTTGQSSSSTWDARTLSVQGDGIVSAGWSNGSIRISATQSNQAWSGSNASSTFQTLSFNNANGVSWSNNGGAVEASYTRPVVSNAIQSVGSATNSGTNTSRFAADDHVHAGVFSVGVSNDAGNSAGDTRVDVGRFVFRGGNNVTLSQITAANALNTIVISGGAGGAGETRMSAYAVSNTTQSTSGTIPLSLVSFQGNGIVSAGISNGSVVISATQSNQAASGQNGSFAFETISFSNANGVSFGTSAGPAITASVAAQSNQTGGIYVTAQSTGQSSSSTYDLRTLSFVPDGIISAGWSNGSFRVSATQSNQAFSAAGGSSAFQTLGFSDNGFVSFTNSNGSVAVTELRGSFFATSNTTQSSSGTINLDSVIFAGAGIASVGVTNGSVVVSVPAGGGGGDGGVFAGVSNLGNTAGSTGTVSTGNFVLVGSNGISLSQSTGAAGSAATVTIIGPQITLSGWNPYQDRPYVTGQIGQGTLQFDPISPDAVFQCDRLVFGLHNTNSSNSSGSHTISMWAGIYTRNVSTLSLLTSTSSSTALTHSGTAGSYSLYSSGPRLFTIPFTTTLTEGDYWFGFLSRTTSGGANGSYSNWVISNIASNFMGHFGSSHATTAQFTIGQGVYTATTSSIPNSVAFTQIRGSDSIAFRAPIVMFASGTI